MIELILEPAQLLQLLASTIFPLLVGLITTRDTNPNRRAVLLAALAVLTSLAAELAGALQSGQAYNLAGALLAALTSFLIAVGMHFGLWKPTAIADMLQAIGSGPAPDPVPTLYDRDLPAAGAVEYLADVTPKYYDDDPLPAIVEDGPRHAAARPPAEPREPRH
jgi:hypothetical protein